MLAHNHLGWDAAVQVGLQILDSNRQVRPRGFCARAPVCVSVWVLCVGCGPMGGGWEDGRVGSVCVKCGFGLCGSIQRRIWREGQLAYHIITSHYTVDGSAAAALTSFQVTRYYKAINDKAAKLGKVNQSTHIHLSTYPHLSLSSLPSTSSSFSPTYPSRTNERTHARTHPAAHGPRHGARRRERPPRDPLRRHPVRVLSLFLFVCLCGVSGWIPRGVRPDLRVLGGRPLRALTPTHPTYTRTP